MPSMRRFIIYVGITLCAFIVVGQFRQSIVSTAWVRYESFFPGGKTKHSDGKFHWADVPVDYPVKTLTKLPRGRPQKLPRVQFDFPMETEQHAAVRKDRQAAVKASFARCWKTYKKFAWMKDEVTPINGYYKNGFGGWAATLVDSLDTLWLMGYKDEFEAAVQATMDIDLGIATMETINVFETTIRHLGGLLSAYDLSGDKRLLEKAKEFGEMLLKAFDTPNRMPITRWRPQEALSGKQEAPHAVLVAEIGSLTMEFTRLSQITRDLRWSDAVDRIMQIFNKQIEDTHLPGMFPVSVNAQEGDFTKDTFFTLSAMSDSFYEYFPKMHALLGGLEPMYKKMYTRSMQVAIKNNLWKPMTPDEADILMSGNVRVEMGKAPTLEPQGQHLVCFAGGMFALGGRLFQDEEHLKIAQKLTDGCIWTYLNSPMGVMPEIFSMVPCASRAEPCRWDQKKWESEVERLNQNEGSKADVLIKSQRLPPGYTAIHDRRYILRPEAIESVFILYRTTGQEYLLEVAWEMFTAIINATETPLANAALADVTFTEEELKAQNAQVKFDSMESFWMAETLKYFYLIFSEPDVISLDKYVFNTEAHPFKRPLP